MSGADAGLVRLVLKIAGLVGLVLMLVGLLLAYGVRRTPTLTILTAGAATPELWCIAHHNLHHQHPHHHLGQRHHVDCDDCHPH